MITVLDSIVPGKAVDKKNCSNYELFLFHNTFREICHLQTKMAFFRNNTKINEDTNLKIKEIIHKIFDLRLVKSDHQNSNNTKSKNIRNGN